MLLPKPLVIDISEHQPPSSIDYDKISKSINGVIIRVQYGSAREDIHYAKHIAEFKKRNVPIAVYAWARGTDNADMEAEAVSFYNRTIKHIDPVFWWIDVEEKSMNDMRGGIEKYRAKLKSLSGGKVGAYIANHLYASFNIDVSKFDAVWIPTYGSNNGTYGGSNPTATSNYDLHQFTDKGRLEGYNGNLDLNRINPSGKGLNYLFSDSQTNKGGNSKVTTKASTIVAKAAAYIGVSKGTAKHKAIIDKYNSVKPLPVGYKVSYNDDWCDAFITVLAIETGATDIIGRECGVQRHIDIFKKLGIWYEDGTIIPKVGDIITFNWDDSTQGNDGWADHIGIVEKVSGGTITTIEGNYDSRVQRRVIPVGWGYIRGYARPKYAAESTSTTKPSTGTTKPSTTKKSNAEIAKEVVAGKWGNGTDRTSKLKAAGYNPTTIQTEVNKLVKAPSKKSNAAIAKEVIAGAWGNGASRTSKLKAAGYNPTTIQKEVNKQLGVSNKKSTNEIAKEVIAGKWGNGTDRVKRLKAAGYNPTTIQNAVNRLA